MIEAVVIDTDVLSYSLKEDTRAALYERHLAGKIGLVSFVTVAELRQWALIRNWGEFRRQSMESFVSRFTTVHSDDRLCSVWAGIRASAIPIGRPIDVADAWVAATAILFQVPLVTHNRRHFSGVAGLTVVSEA
ncbi:MAG TPA: type II toxin-antitoxin system VapC family toxin [Blastocatellia bacterium]|nr:type II toxin-antitoxin system VapC family toxin [Blastocatellia bacterium]